MVLYKKLFFIILNNKNIRGKLNIKYIKPTKLKGYSLMLNAQLINISNNWAIPKKPPLYRFWGIIKTLKLTVYNIEPIKQLIYCFAISLFFTLSIKFKNLVPLKQYKIIIIEFEFNTIVNCVLYRYLYR